MQTKSLLTLFDEVTGSQTHEPTFTVVDNDLYSYTESENS